MNSVPAAGEDFFPMCTFFSHQPESFPVIVELSDVWPMFDVEEVIFI